MLHFLTNRTTTCKISPENLLALIVSLIAISILPLYVTFILKLWPEPGAIIVDCIYLLILVGFLSVFTGRYRPKWLITTLISLGILNLIGLLWLYAVLNNLNPSP